MAPGSPASPATPATAAAPGTPASPRAAESGQASEDKPADKQSAQNGDAKDDAAREPAAEQQHVQAPQAAPVPDARSEEKPSAQTPEQGAQPEKTDPPAQTEDDPAPSTEPETLEVEVTVDGSAVGSDVWSRSVTLEPGSTVYDALVKTGVDVNARSTVYGIYVAAIGGLAEKEFGPLSVWVYAVDGVEPQVAASGKLLRDGQRITWTYVNVE